MIKSNISLNSSATGIEDILGKGGIVSRTFGAFECRDEQIAMGKAVVEALTGSSATGKRRLAIEAGTGVGKSFAYLVPAILAVGEKRGRVLVSTYTITLQEQLINKDLPFLADCLPFDFNAVLAKGRGNYVCLRRLDFAMRKGDMMFSQIGDELAQISRWATETKDGSLSDIPFVPSSAAAEAVKSEHGNCPGRKCKHFQKCFYRRARRQLEAADIIVANHALLFSDLAIKEGGASLLPEYRHVIIDEAHNIESVAQDHFGIDISDAKIKYLLDGLYNPRIRRGLLAYSRKAEAAIEMIGRIKKESTAFFGKVTNWYESNVNQNGGRCRKNFVDDNLSGSLKRLSSELSGMAGGCEDVDEKFEIIRFVNRCSVLVKDLADFLNQERSCYVYWVEVGGGRRKSVRLKSAALNVGPDVKRCLFDKYESVILTSATLSSDGVDEKTGFDFFAERIGLENFDATKLGSPFDYANHVTIYLEKDLPNPNDRSFMDMASEAVKKYVLQTHGRAFVLFTSYSMLNGIADKVKDWLAENEFELLQQGSGVERGALLKQFKAARKAVLFGTDSFWQGVDVPGGSLSNVIIVKLPFAVPNQPLLAGRLEQIREKGGNPFFDYQLPSAIIKFKQGFGRLIRSKKDMGIVVILDSRIVQKRYGARFLSAIPKCKVEIVSVRG